MRGEGRECRLGGGVGDECQSDRRIAAGMKGLQDGGESCYDGRFGGTDTTTGGEQKMLTEEGQKVMNVMEEDVESVWDTRR